MDEFEKWLSSEIEYPDHRDTGGLSAYNVLKMVLKKYRTLRAKQTAPQGLVEELAALEHDQWMAWAMSISATEVISQPRVDRWKKCMVPYAELTEEMKEFDRIWARKAADIISRYQPAKVEEPLAVLADRKGMAIGNISHKKLWHILLLSTGLWSMGKTKIINAPTYAEAEAKAKSYLEGHLM